MPATNTFQCFVINLDRSPDRLEAMRRRLARTGLPWERVEAVDGRTVDIARCADVSAAGYQRDHGKELNAAEVGCYFSHLATLRRFLAGPWQWALVLEDDADFPLGFTDLIDHLTALGQQWDIVKLSRFHSGTPVRVAELVAPYALAVPLSRLMNANAILYNRRAAQVLVDKLLPMRLPYDHALERAWLFGLKLRVVTPSPCPADTGLASTIGDRQHLRRFKLPPHRRLPAMWFRLRTEVLRVGFGVAHWLRAPPYAGHGGESATP